MNKDIIEIKGGKSGPTVAIFCGVHGNEKAGIMTVDHLRENLQITSGTLYLVYANPKAIKEEKRFIEKNLNRCFLPCSMEGMTYEERRAVELMKLLDECDGLLDLHAYSEPIGGAIPFVISELNAEKIIKKLDVKFVVTGIDEVEKGGTDGYMSNHGKIGVCLELGAIETPEKFVGLGINSCHTFLNFFGMHDIAESSPEKEQVVLRVTEIYKKKDRDFLFSKKFKTFDFLEKNELICTDGGENIYTKEESYILFPRDSYDPGIEAFILAEKMK